MIEGDDNLLNYATSFYKNLFGPVDLLPVSLVWPVEDVLSDEAKDKLAARFTLEEIKEAVFSMKLNKASGPDGFPIEFYQKFWGLISNDLFLLFQDFFDNKIDISRLNYGTIILIAKGLGADKIQMYRPICLLNVLFKFFTKVMNNRAILVAEEVISKIQSAFIKGRFILDSVVVLHETMHYIHKKKSSGVLFKVDFEKAYDKINWDFMFAVLEMKGFPTKFVELTKKVVKNGKVSVMVNDKVGPYFTTRKGLRQGDPFSPIFFNIAADVVATLVSRAQDKVSFLGLFRKCMKGVFPCYNMQTTRFLCLKTIWRMLGI
jgi:hypothetical protein